MRRALFAAAAALTLLAEPALAAPNDANEADLRCLFVAGAAAGATDQNEQTKRFASMMAIYYLGRIRGRSPGLDVAARAKAMAPGVKLDDLQSAQDACVATFKTEGQMLLGLGEALKAMAQAPAQASP